MPTIDDLGQKVKAKYPGQYDDLSDSEVGQKVQSKFPGAYDDFTAPNPAPASSPTPTLGAAAKAATALPYVGPMVKEAQQFGSRLASNLNPIPLARALMHPIDTLGAMVNQSGAKANEAAAAAKQGNFGRAALSGAEAVPLVGPIVSQTEQDVKDKNYGGIGGTAASLALPSALKRANLRIPIRSNLNPVEQSAVQWGQRADVPIDVGVATDNPAVRTIQETVARQPFTASKAAALRQTQDTAMQQAGQGLAASVSPQQAVTPLEAGENVQQTLTRRIGKLNDAADVGANKFRQIASQPQNVKQVQTGTQTSPVLGPGGQPITTPVMQDIALPVDRTGTKALISPIVKQLDSVLPEAQRQASPGYRVLRQILDGPDQVPAKTAISDLSAVQNIARTYNELPEVKGVSKGLAASAIPSMRQALDDAAAGAGADATQALGQMRTATKSKYAVNAILKALPTEPAQVYGRLTRAGDRSANILQDIQQRAPNTLPQISRAYLDGLVDDMTYQGDLRRAQSAVRKWQAMGDKTKQILFPDPAVRQNVTDFVNLAEMMTRRVNPSGSGTTWAAVTAMFHPKILGAELLAGTKVTDMLFGGGGPQMAAQGLKIPTQVPGVAAGAVVAPNVAIPSNRNALMGDYYSRQAERQRAAQ